MKYNLLPRLKRRKLRMSHVEHRSFDTESEQSLVSFHGLIMKASQTRLENADLRSSWKMSTMGAFERFTNPSPRLVDMGSIYGIMV